MSENLRKRYVTVDGHRVPYRYNIRTREVRISLPGFSPWKAECWTSAPEEVTDVVRRNTHKLSV